MMTSNKLTLVLALTGAALIAGCSDSSDRRPDTTPPPVEPPEPIEAIGYSATVHRTEAGFPHIIANDFGSVGFGTGYAAAEDNFCIMAENILRVRGQLAEFLGSAESNVNSDLFRAYMVQTGMYDADVSPEMEYMYTGFAAGYNHYLRQTGISNINDPACQGADWVPTMTADDVRRSELTPAFLPRLSSLFLAATPPVTVSKLNKDTKKEGATEFLPAQSSEDIARAPQPALSEEETLQLAMTINEMATARDKGSNGVAIGSELTDHSGGILYTNPHLDWDFSFFFFPRHQIIPGVTNLLGANTYERSLMGFGTNGDVAWTNTVTASRTQALYELELAPGNPLAYMFDGEEEAMEQITVTINVLGDDGNLTEQSHTLYETRHGLILGLLFGWDNATAFSLRVADEGNRGQNGQNIALARAKTVEDVKAAMNTYQGSANTNTIAADSSGSAFYGDVGAVVNMTDAQLEDCATDTPVLISFFAPAFRGDTSECTWRTDPDSAADGLLGASKQATLIRKDYVTNSNDSFWLANPNEPITGIPLVQGETEEERTLRTRSGLVMIQERMDGTDGLGGNTFNIDSLVERMLSNQNYAGQLLRGDLVTLCENNPSVDLDGVSVDISEACDVLAKWDVLSNLDSRGAHLFREFMRVGGGGRELPDTFNYRVPFDLEDPVNTPRGLDTSDNPEALIALAEAVQTLSAAGIALDAQLGDIQSTRKNDQVIPLHGGEEFEGVFNKMSLDLAGSEGYNEVTGSSASWIMAVEFAESGVKAKGILSYSISSNSQSERYAEMTEMFSRKALLDLPYELEAVEAAAQSTVLLSEGTSDCAGNGWQGFAELAFSDEDACRAYFSDLEANQLTDWVDG
ncbi:MAG: penicillin acylase family protein [Halioglobus sp.]